MGLQLVDETGALITGANPLPVEVSGPLTATLDSVSLAALEQTSAQLIDAAGNPLASSTGAPAGTERALIVRVIPGGTQAVSASALPLPAGAATETTAAGIRADLGTDGASAPSIAGTGVRGWLRSIYDRLSATLTVSGTVTANAGTGTFNTGLAQPLTDAQLRASALPVSVGNFPTTQNVAVTNTPSVSISGAASVNVANSPTVSVSNFPTTQNVSGTVAISGTSNVALASGPGTAAGTPAFTQEVVGGAAVSMSNPVPVLPVPSALAVSAVGAGAAAVTATLPAAGAGLFHYIDAIEITLMNSAARTGSATPVTVTSTNLPGGLAWTFGSAGAIGTTERYVLSANRPVRSATANTATTIVCPATTGALWRVNVIYSTAP